MNAKARPNVSPRMHYALVLGLLCNAACASDKSDRALAASLANDRTRQTAIASIVASGRGKVPLLLSWAKNPPKDLGDCGFYTGLADAFGELRTNEAISFLVKNISFYRSCVSLAPWLKTPEVIEWQLPAVGALIKIGPDASKAVIAAFPAMTNEEDRRAAVFVVARIKGVAEAQSFLKSVSARAGREQYWAEEGIKLLETSSSPGR